MKLHISHKRWWYFRFILISWKASIFIFEHNEREVVRLDFSDFYCSNRILYSKIYLFIFAQRFVYNVYCCTWFSFTIFPSFLLSFSSADTSSTMERSGQSSWSIQMPKNLFFKLLVKLLRLLLVSEFNVINGLLLSGYCLERFQKGLFLCRKAWRKH